MAFYNANTIAITSGEEIKDIVTIEPSKIQSLLIYNQGPDTVYIGNQPDLDNTGLTATGFPLVKADTLGMSWLDFDPVGRRSVEPFTISCTCMSGASAVVNTFGYFRRSY